MCAGEREKNWGGNEEMRRDMHEEGRREMARQVHTPMIDDEGQG
jgi:hypothetical protein